MPNQRDIAKAAGVHQATVSLALRGDRSISRETAGRVRRVAAELGYRPNAYVASLMAHIRSGQRPSEQGVIAMAVEARSEREWHRMESYRIFHEGAVKRAAELGFRVECFYLQAPGMNAQVLERILEARGIRGLIFAPPYRGNRRLAMRWERYACVGMGHGWESQQLDRVANDHAQNVLLAFAELQGLGYRRIGTLLGGVASVGGKGLKWYSGYLESLDRLPAARRIPVHGAVPNRDSAGVLRQWLKRWRPDVLLTINGREKALVEAMGLEVPGDIGMACLVRPRDTFFAGIDEKNEIIGATALELVAAQIVRNQYGLPDHPKLTLIDGRWVGGKSAPGLRIVHRDENSGDCPPEAKSPKRNRLQGAKK